MHSDGHFGLTLLFMSLISVPFGFGNDYVVFLIIVLSAGLSSIPDIDLKYEIAHRKYTHNVLFALFMGAIFAALFQQISVLHGLIGFTGGFMGVMLHLLGDLMTYMPFKPFWPFSQKKIALHLFPSNSKTANKGFFYLGLFSFFVYLMVSSGYSW